MKKRKVIRRKVKCPEIPLYIYGDFQQNEKEFEICEYFKYQLVDDRAIILQNLIPHKPPIFQFLDSLDKKEYKKIVSIVNIFIEYLQLKYENIEID